MVEPIHRLLGIAVKHEHTHIVAGWGDYIRMERAEFNSADR
jgi:hypothetical protein